MSTSKTTVKTTGRKRGRPARPKTEEQAVEAKSVTRPKRVPLSGQRDRLSVVDKDPNYQYRVVVPTVRDPNRVERAIAGGYEVVDDEHGKYVEGQVGSYREPGSTNTIDMGLGDKGILMRIHKDLYKEDQMAKQAEVDKSEEQIYNKHKEYGLDGTPKFN